MAEIDCLIIGGGPAGMMAACTVARAGVRTLLYDKNEVLGKKLRITGKGRCNVTNACTRDEFFSHIIDHPKFLYGSWAAFSPEDTVSFFEELGVPLKTERGNRVFPVSDRASDVADAMVRAMKQAGVTVRRGSCRALLTESGAVSGAAFADGSKIPAKTVLLATGGASYAYTGSDGNGFVLARSVGHTVTPIRPALVPLEIRERDICESLQGLSLKNVSVSLIKRDGCRYREQGEMLFTHFGVSGPLILSASCFAEPEDLIRIDLKPALSEEMLNRRILGDLKLYQNRNFSNALGDLLPAKLIPVIVSLSGIDPCQKCHSVTREQRTALVRLFKGLSLTVSALRPLNEAIVTSGGVCTDEVTSGMQSKRVHGLFFAGEMLNVAAFTGGYNLQIAFSTGYRAAQEIIKTISK